MPETCVQTTYVLRITYTRMRSIKFVPFPMTLNEPKPCFHSLMLNISQTATDTATVTIEGEIGNRTQAFEWHHSQ